jgi:hypothetical protein
MISACVIPTVKHGGGWFGGALLVTLLVIYFKFKAHITSMTTTALCSNTPSHLVCSQWDYHLFYNRTMTQHTSRLCKGYFTKKESDGVLHQMTWPPQSPNLNTIEMVWDELDRRVKEKQPASAQHIWELLQDCWKSFPDHFFGYYMVLYVLFHSLMSSLLFYNVENSEN